MKTSQIAGQMSDTEYLAFRAGKCKALCFGWIRRARVHKNAGHDDALRMCVDEAREANHEYLRHAVEFRRLKDLEAQRREDYRNTLRQY